MPKANAPNSPCVEVCESPHTIVIPGRVVRPSSGESRANPFAATAGCVEWDTELLAIAPERLELLQRQGVGGCIVARRDIVIHHRDRRPGHQTRRLARRRPSNAWGEVTSCTK